MKTLPYLSGYVTIKRGRSQGYWQSREIDRDFLIFDFILFGTVILAGIGVANTILIQVRARDREFAVLKSFGISRGQVTSMLLIEDTIIGCVSAALAVIIGDGLGAISNRFLDHFTLFDYFLRISVPATLYIPALCVLTCVIASFYPAFIENQASSAESLHYEWQFRTLRKINSRKLAKRRLPTLHIGHTTSKRSDPCAS